MHKTNQKPNPGESLALHFRKYGDSGDPAVLILHGLFGSNANWRTIAGHLSAFCEVFCLDLRNHGRSPWHDQMDYSVMAADVARFIADHGLHRPTLLGHSMGGKAAMMLAQNHDVELAKLIVVDIAPLAYRPARHLELMDAMAALDLVALNLASADRRQIDAALAKQITDSATRQFLAQNLIKASTKDGGGYRWRLNLAAIRRNLGVLAGYDNRRVAAIETLFIAGADSDYLPPTGHHEVYARFPNARIEIIKNAGHWLHAQHPERLASLCEVFLRS